jgi:hypothetical protein
MFLSHHLLFFYLQHQRLWLDSNLKRINEHSIECGVMRANDFVERGSFLFKIRNEIFYCSNNWID